MSDYPEMYGSALVDLFRILAQSAACIDYKKTIKLSKRAAPILEKMIMRAYTLGFFYANEPSIDDIEEVEAMDGFPEADRKAVADAMKPLMEIALEMIEISHCPGRIIFFPENKMSVQQDTSKGIAKVAKEYYLAGMRKKQLYKA